MKFEESVGAVVVNDDKFLLLKYKSGHWGLVKGHIEEGETKEETVMRELEEETGITKAVLDTSFNESIGYYFKRSELISKKVTYFLIRTSVKEVRLDEREHVTYAWLTYEKALKRLTFENTRRVLIKAGQFLQPQSYN